MLLDELPDIAEQAAAALEEYGTVLCNVVRPGSTPTGYGGDETTDVTVLSDVRCHISAPSSAAASVHYQLGNESGLAFIMFPKLFGGAVVELAMTDKIVAQANALITHDRTFQIKDINPNSGTYYRLAVTEENKTNG